MGWGRRVRLGILPMRRTCCPGDMMMLSGPVGGKIATVAGTGKSMALSPLG